MSPLTQRLHELESWLKKHRDFWHPQPFRELQPAWCTRWPALENTLLALADDEVERLNDDGGAARSLLAAHGLEMNCDEPLLTMSQSAEVTPAKFVGHWAWGIPGRKRSQIEAFVAAAEATSAPVLEWCAGKGHLGRLCAGTWDVPVLSLEIDPVLCADGGELARRAGVAQKFIVADVLNCFVPQGSHAIALHACGELHRTLLRQAEGCVALDVVPCCYHHGVDAVYEPMSSIGELRLERDDLRLAVTETVTASRRQAVDRDREMAWKLAFDVVRRQENGDAYTCFKPVPQDWLRGSFESFCRSLAQREGLSLAETTNFSELERQGWQRQRAVMRYSIIRHAFRRPLEIWLLLDMAVFLEEQGWQVTLSSFCPRQLTPRNLLISARKN